MPIISDPARLAQVIARRDKILQEIATVLSMPDERRRQSRINRLRMTYSREETDRLLLYMMQLLDTEPEDLDAFHYQRYHETYRHFGGDRPAFDVIQWQALNAEWVTLHVRKVTGQSLGQASTADPLTQKEANRYAEIKDLLLKDSFLWDDITPPDAGRHNLPSLRVMMRQLRKQKAQDEESTSRSTVAHAPMLVTDAPLCPTHKMPILMLNGQERCAEEFVMEHLGNKRITEVEVKQDVIYYVFEDGHRLPLICPCCGGAYMPDGVSLRRANMVGRILTKVSKNHNHFDNSEQGEGAYDDIALHFMDPEREREDLYIITPVAFTAIAQIQHPRTHKAA